MIKCSKLYIVPLHIELFWNENEEKQTHCQFLKQINLTKPGSDISPITATTTTNNTNNKNDIITNYIRAP